MPTQLDLTPERMKMIRRLARTDPYFRGMLAALEPSETPRVLSCPKETP